VYEELKHFAGRWGMEGEQPDRQLSGLELTLCGGLSKLLASVSTYPSQVSEREQMPCLPAALLVDRPVGAPRWQARAGSHVQLARQGNAAAGRGPALPALLHADLPERRQWR
jgi:hypothetical protein